MDNTKNEAILGQSKYLVPNSELPIYLIHVGIGVSALFQLQLGTEKAHGIESKGITSFMTLEQIEGLIRGIAKHIENFDDEVILNNFEVAVVNNHSKAGVITTDTHFIKWQATASDYKKMIAMFWESYHPICQNWNSATNMINITKKQREAKRLAIIKGDNNSDA